MDKGNLSASQPLKGFDTLRTRPKGSETEDTAAIDLFSPPKPLDGEQMDFLIPTALSVDSDLPIETPSVKYPKGKKFHFEFSQQPLAVYQGEVTIRAELKLKASVKSGQRGILRLQLKYQACDDQRCLPPSVSTIQLKFSVS